MTSATILRSPSLAEGGDVRVVRLFGCPRRQAFRNGGLAKAAEATRRAGRAGDDILLHITPKEFAYLKEQWGEPAVNPDTGLPEYGLPAEEASGRTQQMPTGDWYTYGQRPEHQFYSGSIQVPEVKIGIPGSPSAPAAQGAAPGAGAPGAPGAAGGGGGIGGIISTLGTVGGAASLVNQIGKLAGKDDLVQSGLGALGRVFGIGGGLDPRIGAGALGREALDQMSRDLNVPGEPGGKVTTPTTPAAPSMLKRIGSGALGALDVFSGLQQGGVKGVGRAASGASSIADAVGVKVPGLGIIGDIGNILQGDFKTPSSAFSTAGTLANLGATALGGGSAGLAGALGALGTFAPIAALGFGVTDILNNALNSHGDEKRNLAAYEAANPGVKTIKLPFGRASAGLGGVWKQLPDGTLLKGSDYEKLAGTWYGAQFAPDGNQQQWQSDYSSMLDSLGSMAMTLPKGYKLEGDQIVKAAHGGALERLVRGPGDGRSDSIPAELSDGEYVLTAEDVALLGDGSTDAGARRLDQWRQQLRKHKGGALARGKISPDAKPPMAYLKGVR